MFKPTCRIGLMLLALLLVSFFQRQAAHAQTTNIFDARVFNWRFYVNSYGDLLRAGIDTDAEARSHWQNNGLREGRQAHALFHSVQYLGNYADIRNAYGAANYRGALDHYLIFGFNEGRQGYATAGYDSGGTYGRWTVRNNIISVSASKRMAGAVDSVMWNNREFINSFDHGRQLQYAISKNGLGESFNPTEAGSCDDGLADTTSSILEGIGSSGNTLATQSLMAFWWRPGGRCGQAANTTVTSNYRINKNVQVGYGGLNHAIQFLASVYVPENVSSLTLETPTGYLGGEFTSFYTYEPATGATTLLSSSLPAGEQSKPLILSTPDGSAAMGCWAPDLPQPAFQSVGYGQFRFPSSNPANATMKWNMVYRFGALNAGTVLNFRTFVIVGNLDNVKVTMTQLYQKKQAGTL